MEKQTIKSLTAVEWLIKKYQDYGTLYYIDIEQAKEMEKEQIEEAFSIGEMNNHSHHCTGRKIHQDQKDFYNKTYAK